MVTQVNLINEAEKVTVRVLVTGLNEWSLTFNSSNGQHTRNAENNGPIELSNGAAMKNTVDNWRFSIADVNDDTTMQLSWYQGETLLEEEWSKTGNSGTSIYHSTCVYINEES